LLDTFEVWNDAFLTGKKDIEKDFDAYVKEMKEKGIDEFLKIYNDNKKM
jgi:putative aldouronate transport system substrate-binding protein